MNVLHSTIAEKDAINDETILITTVNINIYSVDGGNETIIIMTWKISLIYADMILSFSFLFSIFIMFTSNLVLILFIKKYNTKMSILFSSTTIE